MSGSFGSFCRNLANESSLSPSSLESSEGEGAVDDPASLGLVPKFQTSTRVSLLVESLIRSIVSTYEADTQKATRAYRKICKRLFGMGLIDGSWSMPEFEGARAQFEHGILQLLGVTPHPGMSASLRSLWPGGDSTFHYKTYFDEIGQIGGGAYGKVFRVKHKLDGTEYAVKKIPIHSDSLNSLKNYIKEVKTCASMNHLHIVQYKAAWLEIGSPNDFSFLAKPQWSEPKITTSSSEETEPFISNNKNDTDSDFEILFEDSGDKKKTDTNFEAAFEGSRTSGAKSNEPIPKAGNSVILKREQPLEPRVCWATLYIQMSLCQGTLHQWLRRRNNSFNPENAITSQAAQTFKAKAINEILMQILKGLAYIHSRGIVHHDVKPSNIFVSAEGGSLLVQLGDFGLACPLQRTRHGFPRGTPLYAAPEQLAGRCDPKSDMYSVGIVLFELQEDFRTDMERIERISELRRRSAEPPKDFELNNLVTALVRRLPEERTDASTLLHSLERTLDSQSSQIESLQARLREKDREIQRLTELLRKQDVQKL